MKNSYTSLVSLVGMFLVIGIAYELDTWIDDLYRTAQQEFTGALSWLVPAYMALLLLAGLLLAWLWFVYKIDKSFRLVAIVCSLFGLGLLLYNVIAIALVPGLPMQLMIVPKFLSAFVSAVVAIVGFQRLFVSENWVMNNDSMKSDQLIRHWNGLNGFEIIGTAFAVIGSFLPWGYTYLKEIDRPYVIYGIDVYLDVWFQGIDRFPGSDHGGMIIVVLTLAVVLLSTRAPRSIKNPVLWNLIISILLMTESLVSVRRILAHWEIRFGLIMVVAGSVLLLWMAVRKYRNSNGMKTLAIDD